MIEQNKAPLQENTKDDSSDIERVKKDKERLEREGSATSQNTDTAPPEPGQTKEDEEAEKGHS